MEIEISKIINDHYGKPIMMTENEPFTIGIAIANTLNGAVGYSEDGGIKFKQAQIAFNVMKALSENKNTFNIGLEDANMIKDIVGKFAAPIVVYHIYNELGE